MESCLVSEDNSLPWPDLMLHRIQALEIDESVVIETGIVTKGEQLKRAEPGLRERFVEALRRARHGVVQALS